MLGCGLVALSMHYAAASRRAPAGVCFGAALLFLIGVALTYSRGAYVAILASLVVLATADPASRRRLLAVILVCCTLPAFVPSGIQRVALNSMVSDASIVNRIELWKACLAMAWDEWPSGVGLNGIRTGYGAWYQPEGQFQSYVTGVSDYATIVAAAGIPLAAAIFSLIGVIVWSAALLVHRSPTAGGRAILAVLVCYVVAAAFSTLFQEPVLLAIFGAALLASLYRGAEACRRSPPPKGRLMRPVVAICTTAFVGLPILGAVVASRYSIEPTPAANLGLSGHQKLRVVRSRHVAPLGGVLILSNSWFPDKVARRIARPLVEAGYVAVLYTPPDTLANGLSKSGQILREVIELIPSVGSWFIVGEGECGRVVLLLSASEYSNLLKGVVAINPVCWHPNSELSPESALHSNMAPTLILLAMQESQQNPGEIQRFERRANELRAPISSTWIEIEAPESQRPQDAVVLQIANFFDLNSCN